MRGRKNRAARGAGIGAMRWGDERRRGKAWKGTGHLLACSPSRVAKLEPGDPSASLDLWIPPLLAPGASNLELTRINSARSPGPAPSRGDGSGAPAQRSS